MNLLELGSELLPSDKLISNNNKQNQSNNIIDNKDLSNNIIDNKDLSSNIIDNKDLSNNMIDKTPTLTSSKISSSSNLDKSRVSFDLNKNEIINIDNNYNDNNLILSNNKINNNNENNNDNDNDKKYIFLFIKNHFQTILFILIMIIILISFIKYIHNHKLILNKIQDELLNQNNN